jgi:polyferredoxin
MASGSAATARARRDAAGYWQGASSANGQPRCERCSHVAPSPKLLGKSRYDRLCSLHDAGVKTHGCCRLFDAKAP